MASILDSEHDGQHRKEPHQCEPHQPLTNTCIPGSRPNERSTPLPISLLTRPWIRHEIAPEYDYVCVGNSSLAGWLALCSWRTGPFMHADDSGPLQTDCGGERGQIEEVCMVSTGVSMLFSQTLHTLLSMTVRLRSLSRLTNCPYQFLIIPINEDWPSFLAGLTYFPGMNRRYQWKKFITVDTTIKQGLE